MAKFVPQSEMSLSDQVKVRREKLENLRAEGLDPFVQTRFEVTADSVTIKNQFDAMEGQSVTPLEGIIDQDVDRTISNLTTIGREGMTQTDALILDIMTHKNEPKKEPHIPQS